ncbi:putative cysteine protease RD19D [Camellia lanceoleosa]|uniref:Cysteine protease RD19D n=1 Tax=Camellia lanceoleosa TaxID=1840588 RepID=A0ACC0H484_9ERIC|nr:putative cysteine protease RD19D [Camellia lanceoleosa]
MVGRLRLSYAVGVTIALTCALTLTVATAILHESPQDLKIVQVTEDHNHNNHHHHHLLGTATEHRFESFMRSYGKEYSTRKEYVRRLEIFAENLIRAAEHQAIDPTAVHGVTPFSDLSVAEFEAMYTGVRGGGGGSSHLNGVVVGGTAPEMEVKGLPDSFDWRDRGAVTGVKMQGVCGSCWAFSTTGSIEGANFIATGKLLNLSEQQLVDCDHTCDPTDRTACNDGCSGGLMTNAYKYLMKAGGIEEEDSYPYTGKKGECKFKPEKVAVKVVNFTNVPTDEKQIAANLVHHGPLAIGLNAIFMQTYISGVSCPLVCGKRRINHGVLLVGYGSKGFSTLRFGYRPYWIIKNSWGNKWGEHGYYRLCQGHGMCGMNTMVSAVMTQTSS